MRNIVNTHLLPFYRYDKLIIDDQVYIYNDSEKRIERLPFSVYSTATSGTVSSSNLSHSTSHSNLYTTNTQDSRDDGAHRSRSPDQKDTDHPNYNSQQHDVKLMRYDRLNRSSIKNLWVVEFNKPYIKQI